MQWSIGSSRATLINKKSHLPWQNPLSDHIDCQGVPWKGNAWWSEGNSNWSQIAVLDSSRETAHQEDNPQMCHLQKILREIVQTTSPSTPSFYSCDRSSTLHLYRCRLCWPLVCEGYTWFKHSKGLVVPIHLLRCTSCSSGSRSRYDVTVFPSLFPKVYLKKRLSSQNAVRQWQYVQGNQEGHCISFQASYSEAAFCQCSSEVSI